MSSLPKTLAPAAGMPRRVDAEWLDVMPAYDARAVRSRLDLQRLNRLLGSSRILLEALDRLVVPAMPVQLVEIGAGDGSLMLHLAQQCAARWGRVELTLVDRHPLVDARTLAGFRALGWQVTVVEMDVLQWLDKAKAPSAPIIVANLFVHHLPERTLGLLLRAASRHACAFVCCEPRRDTPALFGSHLLGLLGCNATTRHDAVVSARAGFRDQELSAAWRDAVAEPEAWQLSETAAGWFSHLLVAQALKMARPSAAS